MDIVELKGVNSKMLHRNASSVECVPTTTLPRKVRRTKNEAYCEFDIMANYKQEKQRNAKLKQQRERKEKIIVRKSELSKKIEDLTARNVKIKQMLVAKGNDPGDKHSHQSDDKTTTTAEKRHREHKSQRTGRRKDKLSEQTSEKRSDNSDVVKIRLDSSSTKEEKRSKHRSRKDRNEETKVVRADDTSSSRTGTITVTVTGSKDVRKAARRSSDMSESRRDRFSRKEAQIVEELEQVPESKSQLISVYNYKSKSDERHEEGNKKVIMVFQNNKVIDETDSLMSRDTLKRSKTRTQSFSRERSVGRHRDSEKNEHKPRAIKEDDDSQHRCEEPGQGSSARPPRRRSRSTKVLDSAETNHAEPERVRKRNMSPIYSASPRKELSFSNLILKPTVMIYDSPPPKIATTQTSVSRIQSPGFGTRSVLVDESELEPEIRKCKVMKAPHVLSQTTIAMRDLMQVRELEQAQINQSKNNSPNYFMTSKLLDKSPTRTQQQDFLSKKVSIKSAFSKNSKFHRSKQTPTDRIVEISSKIFKDEKVTFTVEGVEPPKRIRCANECVKSVKTENVFTLQVFPGITITKSDLKCHSHGSSNITDKLATFKTTTLIGNQILAASIDDVGSTNQIITPKYYLGNTRSEFKPKSKESSEVSYKFRKKCWSSKELPKKKCTKISKKVESKGEPIPKKEKRKDLKDAGKGKCQKKRRDMQIVTKDASVQTINFRDNLVEAGVMVQNLIHRVNTDVQTLATLDIGVSTPRCRADCSKQIQVSTANYDNYRRKKWVVPTSGSQSDSNITLNEKCIRIHDYGTCYEKIPKLSYNVPQVKNYLTKQVGVSNSRIDLKSAYPIKKPLDKRSPLACRKTYEVEGRTRKYSHSCSPKTRQSSPSICMSNVMSTGSIKKVAEPTRKSRSKSLSHTRDSLVEKINYNKQTIMHHHQEIAALEKCLNEILHRLVRKDSEMKVQECDFLKEMDHENFNKLSNDSLKFKGQSVRAKPEKSKIPLSKFQRGKAYGEKLKQRSKRSKELTTKGSIKSNAIRSFKVNSKTNNKYNNARLKLRKSHDCTAKYVPGNFSPVKVRSVYKNSKGFVSSATSLSSKISDLLELSSTTFPQSIPSLNIGYSAVQKQPDYLRGSSSSGHKRKNIIKKKHKIHHNKGPVFSKKKSQSIYDMLREYINLANTSSSKMESAEMQAIRDSVSKIVVLSVSSVKLKHTTKYLNSTLPPSTIAENTSDSLSVASKDQPKDKGAICKQPFFITPNNAEIAANVAENTQDLTSADSLEYDTHNTQHTTPDLCPLTAIFNFEPPSYAYLVYNTEVITNPNAPKIDPQPGTSRSEPYRTNDTAPATHKLLPIFEEKPTFVRIAHVSTPCPPLSVIYHEKEKPIADLSPVLNRKVYPSYSERLKQLEVMTSELPEVKQEKQPIRLTSFNCNHKECSQLIFNYTSKRDKCPFLRDKQESSAYHTLTTKDSKSVSAFTDSDTGFKNPNESGYESSKKSSTFRNFFKKRTLFEVFKSKTINKKKSSEDTSTASLKTEKHSPSFLSQDTNTGSVKMEPEEVSPYSESKTVLWFNFRKKKRENRFPCDPWCANKTNQADQTETPEACKRVCHTGAKCMRTGTIKGVFAKECPCTSTFEKQTKQSQKYTSEGLMEAAHRQKGYKKQYVNFDEMPIDVLVGKRSCVCKPLAQTCTQSYANKVAGIQVKQGQHDQPVQVKEVRSKLPMVSIVEPTEPEDVDDDDDTPKLRVTQPELEQKRRKEFGDDDDVTSIEDVSDDKKYLTDKEIFDKLLRHYERKDTIASRLSSDDKFFNEQIESVKAGILPDIQVQERLARQDEEKMRGPRFTDQPRPLVQVTNADTAVKPDDIGTCFARGFRPDNLMLSGDACFHINKQDKIKMSPYMLKNTESIIDFSERETPLDFLLALGFMVDEASNALKDDDIRSRLLAAITEARVWINKITTTQGTLLYLVAYKARPETMRYFLQLVEAIINKRINNAIRLDGFLRVLEDVEAGRLQMINILGEDKFEDEENEEKIVKKQLKNLFISVYTVAEKEASVSGRTLTPNQISLLRILVAKYRAGLHPHLELIARYIGQGLLENEVQLEAAMIFLSRLDTAEVKLKEFENYCGITCQLQDT